MKIIAKIVDFIDDELEGAENYAKCAIEYKSDHPKLAAKMNELAQVEMGHVKQLHSEVVRLIEDYRSTKGEPPKEMLAVYDYEHKKQITRAAIIRQMIAEYENS